MLISTKGRYALRLMLDLAEHRAEGYLSIKEIAARQEISPKYLEAIVAMLTRAGLLLSQRGKDGGYWPKPRSFRDHRGGHSSAAPKDPFARWPARP